MPTNPINAREEVFEFFTEEFIDLPVPCELRYQGKVDPNSPRKFWGRLSLQTVMSEQSAYALTEEPDETPHVFATSGLVYFQVFAPVAERDAFHKGDLLAVKARDIFRRAGTPSGVWFRNARKVELPLRDGDKEYRWNVVVEFEYDERK